METPLPEMVTWFEGLQRTLIPAYTEPSVPGGHDFLHVERMIALGPRIRRFLNFDIDEFNAAVWLHNLDRVRSFAERIDTLGRVWLSDRPGESEENVTTFKRGITRLCMTYLAGSPFSTEAKERIVDAVLQHSKKDDDLERDSTLLTALRIADKAENLSALRILACAAHRGPDLLTYDPSRPFGYRSTDEGGMATLYENFMRILRWYGMLPLEEARALVPIERFRFFVDFVRQFGAEIAEATGQENRVEEDIKRAINEYGNFYERFV